MKKLITALLISLMAGCAVIGSEEMNVGPADGSGCSICTTYIDKINANGGEIVTDSKWQTGVDRVRKLAEANCKLRNFDGASIDENPEAIWHWHFKYSCTKKDVPIHTAPAETTQQNVNPNNASTSSALSQERIETISIIDAKSKCVSLGFKPKTEKFGKCVLELSK